MQSHVHRQAPLRLIAGRHAMQRRAGISVLSMWNRWDQLPPPAPTVESGMGRLAETSRESKLTPRKYVQPFVADEIRCTGRLDPAAGGLCNSAGMSGRSMKPNRVTARQNPSAISSQRTRSASRIQGYRLASAHTAQSGVLSAWHSNPDDLESDQ